MSTTNRKDGSPKKSDCNYIEVRRLQLWRSASGVQKLCNRFQMTRTIGNKEGKGINKSTTATTDRRITRLALGNRRPTARNINNILSDTGVSVSDRTVRCRLVQAGLKARRPRKKPFLNPVQRTKRVDWAKVHLSWSADDWKWVIWSDETKTSIFGDDGIQIMRRQPGEDLLPSA